MLAVLFLLDKFFSSGGGGVSSSLLKKGNPYVDKVPIRRSR